MDNKRKAILVVSFGTSYSETRKKTIEQIEKEIGNAFPEYALYRAWTSGMIRKKLLKRDGIFIADVRGAMEQMKADGITDLIVQPTHVLNGIENDLMLETVQAYEKQFAHIAVGRPLLSSQEDHDRVVEAVIGELCPSSDEALVLMGHGTEHFANSVYAALDYQFKDTGYRNVFMGTVEAYPTFESLLRQVKELKPERVILAPFMIVAGDHATKGSESIPRYGIFSWITFQQQCRSSKNVQSRIRIQRSAVWKYKIRLHCRTMQKYRNVESYGRSMKIQLQEKEQISRYYGNTDDRDRPQRC